MSILKLRLVIVAKQNKLRLECVYGGNAFCAYDAISKSYTAGFQTVNLVSKRFVGEIQKLTK